MDPKSEKFRVNNYVLYKTGNEWKEGRIKSITHEQGKIQYTIVSFQTYSDIMLTSDDAISLSTAESRRKMKISTYKAIRGKIHFPARLEGLILLDYEWSKTNSYDYPPRLSVKQALEQFQDFLSLSCGDSDEIREVFRGFVYAFDRLLPMCLLYRCEQKFKEKKEPASEHYGTIYLLRMLYYLQRKAKNYLEDRYTECILMDYTVYLLDFLDVKHHEYF